MMNRRARRGSSFHVHLLVITLKYGPKAGKCFDGSRARRGPSIQCSVEHYFMRLLAHMSHQQRQLFFGTTNGIIVRKLPQSWSSWLSDITNNNRSLEQPQCAWRIPCKGIPTGEINNELLFYNRQLLSVRNQY